MPDFSLQHLTIGGWSVPVLTGSNGREPVSLLVRGAIGNSVPSPGAGAQRTKDWKRSVCMAIHAARGKAPWPSRTTFWVTLGFRFAPGLHGGRDLDVENFIKPTVDAIAAGLFIAKGEDASAVPHYGYDDSGFRHLLVHRLPDAERNEDEGVAIHIACGES